MKRVREIQDVYCGSGSWLCRAALGVLLLSCTHALAMDDPCSVASSDRVYHPRPLLRLGSLDGCGSPWTRTFMQEAWYASAFAGADQLGVIAINAHGQIVGTRLVQNGGMCVPRPFIWLPVAAYGLNAGSHDLMSLAGALDGIRGYALDITDEGLVVGGSGGIPEVTELDVNESPCRATAWRLAASLAAPTVQAIDLDPIATTPFRWSIAVAAEPAAGVQPLEIVGTGAQICDEFRINARFRLTGAAASVITHAQPENFINEDFVTGLRSWACDVANGIDPVGGFDQPSMIPLSSYPDCDPLGTSSTACEFPYWCGVQFVGSGLAQFRRDPTVRFPGGQITGVRSISHQGGIVAGFVESQLGPCGQQGALWEHAVPGLARVLPTPLGTLQATAQRWRRMPSGCGTDVVLGWSTRSEPAEGVVWSRDANAAQWEFCGWNANLLMPALQPDDGFEILQMYEVNDFGEMTVIVKDTASSLAMQGYYLAILGKAGDFNHDWRVGAPDLSMLLNVWGLPQHMEYDLAPNGVVDAADLANLLNLWSQDSRVALHLPRGGGFCLPEIAEAAPASAGLEVALTAFGYNCCEDFRASVPTLDEPCLNAMCETMSSIIQFFGEE